MITNNLVCVNPACDRYAAEVHTLKAGGKCVMCGSVVWSPDFDLIMAQIAKAAESNWEYKESDIVRYFDGLKFAGLILDYELSTDGQTVKIEPLPPVVSKFNLDRWAGSMLSMLPFKQDLYASLRYRLILGQPRSLRYSPCTPCQKLPQVQEVACQESLSVGPRLKVLCGLIRPQGGRESSFWQDYSLIIFQSIHKFLTALDEDCLLVQMPFLGFDFGSEDDSYSCLYFHDSSEVKTINSYKKLSKRITKLEKQVKRLKAGKS